MEQEARWIGYGDTWQVLVRFMRRKILVNKQLQSRPIRESMTA